MAGWWDSIFGSSPPPAHPASREAAFGQAYAGMPASTNIEDRRSPDANIFPSRPHDQFNRNRIGPFGQTYNTDQWGYLQSHLPGGQPPTTFLPDPDRIVDPSIVAHIKAADALGNQRTDYNDYPDLPTPSQSGRGPQFSSAPGMTLNSLPWGWQ